MSVTYNGTLIDNLIVNDTNITTPKTYYTQSELDSIANAVSGKGSTPTTNTPTDIVNAIDGIGNTGAINIKYTRINYGSNTYGGIYKIQINVINFAIKKQLCLIAGGGANDPRAYLFNLNSHSEGSTYNGDYTTLTAPSVYNIGSYNHELMDWFREYFTLTRAGNNQNNTSYSDFYLRTVKSFTAIPNAENLGGTPVNMMPIDFPEDVYLKGVPNFTYYSKAYITTTPSYLGSYGNYEGDFSVLFVI